MQNDMGAEFVLDDYLINVTFGEGGVLGHRKEGGPVGGGFIIRRDRDRFLICGIACNIQMNPRYASTDVRSLSRGIRAFEYYDILVLPVLFAVFQR